MATKETRITRPSGAPALIDPWGDLREWRRAVRDLFNAPLGFAPSRFFPDTLDWAREPDVDLFETDSEFVCRADLPGYAKEEIDLRVTDDSLHITARHEEKPSDGQDAGENGDGKGAANGESRSYHVRGRRERSFSFDYALPAAIAHEKAQATYKDGVLEVRLPKAETAKPRTVKVAVGG